MIPLRFLHGVEAARPRAGRLGLAATLLSFFFASPVSGSGGPVQVTAVRLDGTTVTGSLEAFGEGRVRVAAAGRGRPVELRMDDLLSLDLPERKASAASTAVLEFANGDRVAVEIGSVGNDILAAEFGGVPVNVPLETLRGIAFAPPAGDNGLWELLLREEGANDLVALTNGDRLAGQFVGLSATELRLDLGGREQRVAHDRIACLSFSPELTAAAAIDGPKQVVQSALGWLTVRDLRRGEDGSWEATTGFGEPVTWPAGTVGRVLFAGGRGEFLSEIEPNAVEFVPYLDRIWRWRRDRAVTGEPLSAGGTTFPRGLGMHSRSRVTYGLGGRYASFRAVIGLSPSAGETGSAEFAVEADGREVFRSGPVTAADAKQVGIDLTGAETLILTVDFGRNGDVRDRANWCDAVLVKK